MKFWIGVILVSPFWGLISTQLFLQAWLAFFGGLMSTLGLVRGRVPRKDTSLQIGVAIFSVVLWTALMRLGFWLIVDVLQFGASDAENVVYWIFAAFSALYMLPQFPRKLRNSWHFAMTPGFSLSQADSPST